MITFTRISTPPYTNGDPLYLGLYIKEYKKIAKFKTSQF